jgi:transcriptional regulator with XRE-family HTH domain
MARRAKVSESAISRLESGKTDPLIADRATVQALAEALGIPVIEVVLQAGIPGLEGLTTDDIDVARRVNALTDADRAAIMRLINSLLQTKQDAPKAATYPSTDGKEETAAKDRRRRKA